MRVALVSPYSWTYQGGVNRHVEALAEEFLGRGHHVRVLAPFDPPGRLSRGMHRGAPEPREVPDYLIPLGRTIGIPSNGAISNLAPFPAGGVYAPRRELRRGHYDVVHIHEPLVPLVGWNAALGTGAPAVGTFHAYSTKGLPNHIASALGARRVFNRLSARIAVSEAAAWTGRRWFGGHYEVIPNGVDLAAVPDGPKPDGKELRVLFIGRPEERKGLPILLSAFGALVEHVPSRLTVIGAEREDVLRYLADPETIRHIDVRGRVSGEALHRALHEADLLCAPSLSGESFGMVLTEAFAAGTPVIASAIAGYSDVVTDGVDGVLVPPGDAQRLAEELQRAHHEPERLATMGKAAQQERRALRLATRRRSRHPRLRTGDRGARAAGCARAHRPLGRGPASRRHAAPPTAATALARPGARPAWQASPQGRAPHRTHRGRGGGRWPHGARGAEDRRRQRRRQHRPLRPHLGSRRLRADGALTLLPRCVLVLDRARGAAAAAGAPP